MELVSLPTGISYPFELLELQPFEMSVNTYQSARRNTTKKLKL
jgi:hypothetical protein